MQNDFGVSFVISNLDFKNFFFISDKNFQVEKKEDGIAGEREENPVMEAVRRKSFM